MVKTAPSTPLEGITVMRARMGSWSEEPRSIDVRLAVVLLLVAMTACANHEIGSGNTVVAEASVPCPSQDFRKFLQVFTESADVQRQFTSLPLEHGRVDVAAIDTAEEYSLQKIET